MSLCQNNKLEIELFTITEMNKERANELENHKLYKRKKYKPSLAYV